MDKNIPVLCAYSKIVSINQLKPNPKNPTTHSDDQITKLAKIIQAHGWRHPITVSNLSGLVVSGHARLMAAQKLGLDKVPVDYQDFSSQAEEMAVLVADNKIAELSETDSQKMMTIVKELEAAEYDLELTAIDPDDLQFIDGELEEMAYHEEELKPYNRTHILLSFSPELLMQIQPYLDSIINIRGVEYEQASN